MSEYGDWDWKCAVPIDAWHDLQLNGFPGWDRIKDQRMPAYIELTIIKGKDISSRDLAVAWDDIGHGKFYYRDWTESGLQFVDGGEQYKSAFWFQKREDAGRFKIWAQEQGANVK